MMLGYGIMAFKSIQLDKNNVCILCELLARFFHRTTIVSANVAVGGYLAIIQSHCRYVMSRRIDQVINVVAVYLDETLTPALRHISQKAATKLKWTRIGVTCCFECDCNNDNYMVNLLFFFTKRLNIIYSC
jgi:hypothetical protein